MSARDELAAIIGQRRMHTNMAGDQHRATADAILAAGYRKVPEAGIGWGVAAKWGPRPYGTKEAAIEYVEWSRRHYPQDGTRLVKRVAASQPGPWEDA